MTVHRRLLAAGRHATAAVGAAVAIGAVGALLAVAQAGLLAHAIAGAIRDGADVGVLGPTLGALAAVLAARAGLGWGADVVAARIASGVKAELRAQLVAAAVALGPRLATERSTARVALLATRGLDALDGYFGRYLPQVALAAIVPVGVVACLLAIDLVAALTVAATVPLIPVFMILIGRAAADRRDRRWAALARLAHRFADVVGGLPTLRAYGRADAQVGILRRATDAYRTTTLETLRIAFLSALALELLSTISVALVAVGIGLRLVAGDLGLETGLFALILAPEAYLPLRRLGAEFHASEEGVAAAREAFALIDEAAAPAAVSAASVSAGSAASAASPSTAMPVAEVPVAGVRVDGLSVEQPGRDVVAPADVTLSVAPGEVVAVVGASGAGKSTLLAALLGFVEPTRGCITVIESDGDPVPLAALDPGAWRASVAWVPQVPYLVPGSLAENVRLARPDASDDDVEAALATVGLAGSAGRQVGEAGRGLSGGERRRLALARALARRSSLLLLDEPTAGLDPVAEAAVVAAIRAEADRGAAVLLVSHRPGAVAGADRTIVVRSAAVREPASLMPQPTAREPVGAAGAVR